MMRGDGATGSGGSAAAAVVLRPGSHGRASPHRRRSRYEDVCSDRAGGGRRGLPRRVGQRREQDDHGLDARERGDAEGRSEPAGPVVVPLFGGAAKHSGCVKAAKSLIAQIAKTPSAYYVNVHNTAFPNGAIRGQL